MANALDLSEFENVDVSHGKVVNFRGTDRTTLCLRKGAASKGEKEYRRKQKRADIIRKANDDKSTDRGNRYREMFPVARARDQHRRKIEISCGSTSIVSPQARPTRSPPRDASTLN